MALRLEAEECARSLLSIYEAQPLAGVEVEHLGAPAGEAGGVDQVDVYVKSVLEPSIDEVPVLQAVFRALEGVQAAFYDYDPASGRGTESYAALRLVRENLAKGRPFILVLPGQRSVVLARHVPEEEWEALEESLALRVTVRAGNVLYLPRPPLERPARLTAKANSEQSYERVVWLTRVAREEGVPLREPRFLPSNREIFEYVFSIGSRGPLERVPVNKLASYIVALEDCGYTPGPLTRLTRIEASTHYIYAYRVPGWLLDRLASELAGVGAIDLRGPLYNMAFQGAARVFEEILAKTRV